MVFLGPHIMCAAAMGSLSLITLEVLKE